MYLPELYLLNTSAHSRPLLAIKFASRTRCHANNEVGLTASYRELLNTLFVVWRRTILLPNK